MIASREGDQPDLYLVVELNLMKKNKLPYVTAALFCEKVIRETDDVLTVVRIVDKYILDSDPVKDPLPGIQPMIQPTLLVMLKGGEITGPSKVTITSTSPTGRIVKPERDWPIQFKGGSHGASIILSMGIAVTEYGIHWFEISWEGQVLTRVPLEIKPGEKSSPAKGNG